MFFSDRLLVIRNLLTALMTPQCTFYVIISCTVQDEFTSQGIQFLHHFIHSCKNMFTVHETFHNTNKRIHIDRTCLMFPYHHTLWGVRKVSGGSTHIQRSHLLSVMVKEHQIWQEVTPNNITSRTVNAKDLKVEKAFQ